MLDGRLDHLLVARGELITARFPLFGSALEGLDDVYWMLGFRGLVDFGVVELDLDMMACFYLWYFARLCACTQAGA